MVEVDPRPRRQVGASRRSPPPAPAAPRRGRPARASRGPPRSARRSARPRPGTRRPARRGDRRPPGAPGRCSRTGSWRRRSARRGRGAGSCRVSFGRSVGRVGSWEGREPPLGPAVLEAAGAAAGRPQARGPPRGRRRSRGRGSRRPPRRPAEARASRRLELVERDRAGALDVARRRTRSRGRTSITTTSPRVEPGDELWRARSPRPRRPGSRGRRARRRPCAPRPPRAAKARARRRRRRRAGSGRAPPRAGSTTRPASAQDLEVLGGVRHRQPRRRGELLDRALALGQQVEHRQARSAAERLADLGQLLEDASFFWRSRPWDRFNHQSSS